MLRIHLFYLSVCYLYGAGFPLILFKKFYWCWLTMLCFRYTAKWMSYTYIHSFFCHTDHYRVLSRVLCAIQQFFLSGLCMLSHFSHVWLFAREWTIAHQASLSMGFSRQEYWSGLPFPTLLCILVCICQYQSPNVFLSPVSTGNRKFSTSNFSFVNKLVEFLSGFL